MKKISHLPKNLKGPFTLLKRIAVTENMQKIEGRTFGESNSEKVAQCRKNSEDTANSMKIPSCFLVFTWAGTL